MDGYAYDETEAARHGIQEMLAKEVLPPDVTGFNVVFGNYMDGGDPAVWLQLQIPSSAHFDDVKARQYAKLLTDLQQTLTHVVPDRLAFVEMRLPPDDPELNSARADA